ncbi:MAG: dihydropteroate synthase [Chthoniobacterales bacterium]
MAAVLWKFANQRLDLTDRAMIMGVINVTPDSFSDGGRFFDPARAIEHGTRMLEDGAQIIDVGGESTRPGSDGVAAEEEISRVVPVIAKLREAGAKLISIDTSKATVARAALEAGAEIVNDVTGGRGDEAMMPLIAKSNAGFIIMHMQGTPRTMQDAPHYDDVVAEVRDFFRQQYSRAIESGVDPMAIAFDPGIGFGKTLQHNVKLVQNLSELRIENRPLVIGVSRKSFLAKVVGSGELDDRLAPTVALTALLRERGANVLRVHDVRPNVAALRITEALRDIAA